MTKRISFEDWAKDEDAQFGGNYFDDDDDVKVFVAELLDNGVKSVEVGMYHDESIGDMYLEVDELSKNLVAVIVSRRPDDCRIEHDDTLWIWWD